MNMIVFNQIYPYYTLFTYKICEISTQVKVQMIIRLVRTRISSYLNCPSILHVGDTIFLIVLQIVNLYLESAL